MVMQACGAGHTAGQSPCSFVISLVPSVCSSISLVSTISLLVLVLVLALSIASAC